MMIRHFLQVTVAAALLLADSVCAATAKTYQEALRKSGGSKPVVLFCYGANYDNVSEQAYESFIKKRGIAQAVRNWVFLEVPVLQPPNEKELKQWHKIMGQHSLPAGIWSYPCLVVLDGSGNLRGVVQSADEMKSPESATPALLKLLASFEAQEKILDKAQRLSGDKKTALLAQAADVQLHLPAQVAGPPFDPITVVEALQPMSAEEANNYVRSLVDSGFYTRRQRQEIMAAYAGHLRRNGCSANRLRAVYTEMRNIDPHSVYAAYAEGAIALWVAPKEADPSQDTPYIPVAQRKNTDSEADSSSSGDSYNPMGDKKPPAGGTASDDEDDSWTPMGSSKKPGEK